MFHTVSNSGRSEYYLGCVLEYVMDKDETTEESLVFDSYKAFINIKEEPTPELCSSYSV